MNTTLLASECFFSVGQTPLIGFVAEDGPSDYYQTFVQVTVPGGAYYNHPHFFGGIGQDEDGFNHANTGRYECEQFIERIKAAGVIDLRNWEPEPVRPSLESIWHGYAVEEAYERWQHTGQLSNVL